MDEGLNVEKNILSIQKKCVSLQSQRDINNNIVKQQIRTDNHKITKR